MYFSFKDRKKIEGAECRQCTNSERKEYMRKTEEITKEMAEFGITMIQNYWTIKLGLKLW